MSDDTRLERPTTTAEPALGGEVPPGHEPAEAPLNSQGTQAAATAGAPPTRQASLWGDAFGELRRSPIFIAATCVILVIIAIAIFPSLFTNTDPRACNLSQSRTSPGGGHIFGTDLQGCDYYTRVIYGARASIIIGFFSTMCAAAIAVVFGALAGYYGGVFDAIVARIADVWFAIPTTLGGVVILTSLGNQGIVAVSLVLVALGWPTMLRLMRSSVLSAKEADYVQAARALGGGDIRILRRHILPNSIAPVVVYATIYVGIIIAAEAALSFLGVGLELPAISWGLMLNQAQSFIRQSPYLLVFPGLFLSVTILAFILMGDQLRDALDPKLR
jgi:ABC-type dipeptide/oligopeptide/nickel transport system permease subunit